MEKYSQLIVSGTMLTITVFLRLMRKALLSKSFSIIDTCISILIYICVFVCNLTPLSQAACDRQFLSWLHLL